MGKQGQIKKITVKHYVFIFFCATLFFPLIQQHTKIIREKKLEGFFKIEDYPSLNWEKWSTGEYQKQFETAINDNVGFHDFFVELQSQLNYSIYNISKIQSVVVGKEGYLYVQNYIDAVNGNDFMGSAYINLQIEKAKVVDSVLKSKNIDLIFAIAPGKGSYFPEYIPNQYKGNNPKDSTNYECYKNGFINSNLNFIDLRDYLLKIKYTGSYQLFSKVGVHWGEYASYLAIDSITKYIAKIKNNKFNNFYFDNVKYEYPARPSDYDAGNLMNTLTIIPHYPMPYFNFKYNIFGSVKKNDLLVVGDSYYSCIRETKIPYYLFNKIEYKLYNKPRFKEKEELEKHSTILIIGTDGTLSQYPYDFINQTFEVYSPRNKSYVELKRMEFNIFIHGVLNNIKKNKKWQKQLIKAANLKKISATEEFVNNAIWLYNNR